MNKLDLVQKLEDAINSFKQEVDKNEGSTLTTIANTISSGFDSLMDSISSNKKAQKMGDALRKHLNDLEDAIIQGDKKISATAMSAMQKGVQELKKKLGDENEAPVYEYTGKPTVKYTPNKSKVFTAGKHQDVPVAKPVKRAAKTEKEAKPKTARNASVAKKATGATKKATAGAAKKTAAAAKPKAEAKAPAKTAAKPKAAAKPKTAKPKE